ncbi:hypothetical protein WJX74_010123 [Apatococcus lobatus]|uniref:Uncharacterized protein n=1 Tax=Apatococcus lobatus TaxID=904363 RepID=A0AAW1R154_9CHLO
MPGDGSASSPTASSAKAESFQASSASRSSSSRSASDSLQGSSKAEELRAQLVLWRQQQTQKKLNTKAGRQAQDAQAKAPGTTAKANAPKANSKRAPASVFYQGQSVPTSTAPAPTKTSQNGQPRSASRKAMGSRPIAKRHTADHDDIAAKAVIQGNATQQQQVSANVQPAASVQGGQEQSSMQTEHAGTCRASTNICESAPAKAAVPIRSDRRRDSEASSIASSMYSSKAVPAEQQQTGHTSRPPLNQARAQQKPSQPTSTAASGSSGQSGHLHLLRAQALQLRHLNCRVEAAMQAAQQQAPQQLAKAAMIVAEAEAACIQAEAVRRMAVQEEQADSALDLLLPTLECWKASEEQQNAHLGAAGRALETSLLHVPLVGGATVGPDPQRPDDAGLQSALEGLRDTLASCQPGLDALCSITPRGTDQLAGSESNFEEPNNTQPKGIEGAAGLTQELAKVSAEVVQTTEANASLIQQLQSQLLQCQSLAVQVQQAQWAGICI